MKLSELRNRPKPPKILLYGPAGSGKTGLALTMGPGTRVLDLEDGLMTGLTLKDQFSNQREQVEVFPCLDKTASRPEAFGLCRQHVMTWANEPSLADKCRGVVLDSLTGLTSHALRRVLANSKRLDSQPQIQDWGNAFIDVESVLTYLIAMPVPVVVIAHDVVTEVSGVNKVGLALPGKSLDQKVIRMFDEIYYVKTAVGAGNKTRRLIQTASDFSVMARSRHNLPETDLNIGLPELFKKLGFQLKEVTPT